MRTKCLECEQECGTHTIDEGGYEEVWGARMWHHQYTEVSDCCHSEYEEMNDVAA